MGQNRDIAPKSKTATLTVTEGPGKGSTIAYPVEPTGAIQGARDHAWVFRGEDYRTHDPVERGKAYAAAKDTPQEMHRQIVAEELRAALPAPSEDCFGQTVGEMGGPDKAGALELLSSQLMWALGCGATHEEILGVCRGEGLPVVLETAGLREEMGAVMNQSALMDGWKPIEARLKGTTQWVLWGVVGPEESAEDRIEAYKEQDGSGMLMFREWTPKPKGPTVTLTKRTPEQMQAYWLDALETAVFGLMLPSCETPSPEAVCEVLAPMMLLRPDSAELRGFLSAVVEMVRVENTCLPTYRQNAEAYSVANRTLEQARDAWVVSSQASTTPDQSPPSTSPPDSPTPSPVAASETSGISES